MRTKIASCFPDLYPDELLFSGCGRFQKRMQYSSGKSIVTKLFGDSHTTISVDFPSHLTHLVEILPPGHCYTTSDFINNHTLLPFHAPFLPHERVEQIRQDMEGSKGLLVHLRVGAASSSIQSPQWLRFCPLCLEIDINQYSEGYWHRLHQVCGVEVCPIHEVFLEKSNTPARNRRIRYEFSLIEDTVEKNVCPRLLVPSNPVHQNLLKIAQDVAWLLNDSNLPSEPKIIRDRYLFQLVERDLATYTGQVHVKKLLKEFQKFYSPNLLQLLQCELNEEDKNNWLFRLIRSPNQSKHPLYHLLFIQFLGFTAEEFFQLPSELQPFGSGPWYCLNPVCKYFHQPSIKEYALKRDKTHGGRITATFECCCGFAYSRLGPDTSLDNQLKVGKIKAWGHVWETLLRELWEDSTVTLHEMSERLGADPQTIKYQAARLELAYPRSGPTKKQLQRTIGPQPLVEVGEPAKVKEYREEWLGIVKANPDVGRSELSSKHRRVYSWLKFYDQEWLDDHLPRLKDRAFAFPQVSWNQRDLEIAAAIKIAAEKIRNKSGKPEKITKTAIASEAGYLTLIQKQLDRLPLTSAMIAELAETTEDFAVRRIYWVVESFRQKGIHPKAWQIVRQAGLKKYVTEMPKVKEAITSAL